MRERHAERLAGVDLVVPVPLHPSRRRSRGFNQADDLARHLGLPMVCALRRIKATHVQADLPATERLANVCDAFAPTRHTGNTIGRTVVIVDDVTTTGATLEACARVLQQAGAKDVRKIAAATAVLRSRTTSTEWRG
ncbi:MAG TPA: phosphoribosyltransferase family protein [Vicinamibacterales bacterium]|jgi:ComF family protein|nr:phosphoribosyltransferase family protein [Vicinamibacterales bacterium]